MKAIHNLVNRLGRNSTAVAITLFCVVGVVQASDYNVELLVYSLAQAVDSSEQWSTPRDLPDTEHAILIGENGAHMLEGPRSFQAIADTLRRSNQYRLLLHWFWQQPGITAGQAQAVVVQIPAGAAVPVTALPENLSQQSMNTLLQSLSSSTSMTTQSTPLLDGTVKFIADEVLQMDVNLIYRDAGIAVPVQLKESRRLHSGELHYLDHSRVGVLVRVTPQTAATPQ